MSGTLDRMDPTRASEEGSRHDGAAVVFVTAEPFPQSIRIEKEIRTFQRLGFAVEVVAVQEGDQPAHESRDGTRITRVKEIGGVLGKANRALEKLIFVDLAFMIAVLRILGRHTGPVVLFVRGLRLVRTAHWSRILGGGILFYDIHDIHHLAAPSYLLERSFWERLFNGPRRMLRLDKACVGVADRVVVANPPYIGMVADWGADPKKLIFLPNHEDLQWFDGLDADRRFLESYRGRFVLVYIGSFGANRELDVAVRAVAHLRHRIPSLKLVLVGPLSRGDLVHRRRLEELAEELAVSGMVDFVGRAPFERIAEVVGASDICLMPLSDCAHSRAIRGHKLFHYMAGHRPIIASDLPEQRSVIERAGCGLLYRAGDPGSLAERVWQLYEDPARRISLGAHGRRAVERMFSWQSDSKDLVAAVRQLSAKESMSVG